jgi:hypothetical protein
MKRTIIIAVSVGILCACSTLKLKDPMKAFNEANRAYSHAISWSEYVVAATFLKNREDANVDSQIEQLSKFKVTEYKPRTFAVIEEDVRVRQVVKISYFKVDNLVVKSIADDQLWEYDPDKGTWLIVTGLPRFK